MTLSPAFFTVAPLPMLVREKGWFWIASSKIDHVLLCECDHRADELIDRKVDVSGELIADF